MTTTKELILESADLVIKSNQLYLSKGIKYFDKEPAEISEQAIPKDTQFELAKLKAFNLCTIDGVLMASN